MENSKYRAFLCSAELGSFTKASKKLNYTPSGISQLVNALEYELGFPLFHRNKKGVKLTENGNKIIPVIRSLIQYENHLNQLAAEISGLNTGSVTIAAYSSISSHWLPAVIKEFKELYPQIEIHLMEGIRQEVDQWLSEKRADVAFLSYKEPMHYEWFPLAEDAMVAILPKNHPLADQKSYPIHLCQNEQFIMPAFGKDDDVTNLLEQYELSPEIVFSTLENFATMTMVECGLGMSIMNELITKRWECDIRKLPLDPPQHITLGIAVHSFENSSPAVRKFISLARQSLTQ